MPARINIAPQGLRKELELDGPVNLMFGDLVVPTVDIERFYCWPKLEVISSSGNQNAVGIFNLAQVPNDEVWMVHEYSAFALPAPGNNQKIAISTAVADVAGTDVHSSPTAAVDTTVDTYISRIRQTSDLAPFMLPPGWFLRYSIDGIDVGTGGTINVGATAIVKKLTFTTG